MDEWEGFGPEDLLARQGWVLLISSNVLQTMVDGPDLLVTFFSFKTGVTRTYRYLGAAAEASGLITAPSPGGYVHRNLINKYNTVPG